MTEVGTWSDGNWTGGGIFYGTVFRFTDGGQGANTHTWPMDVDGRYAVYVRWSAASNRNATADYTVHHADGTTTVTYDQQTDGGVWKPLGVYDLETSATHKVVLADTGAGYTIADAILLVPMEIESRVVSADAVKLVANDAEDVLTIHADHLGAPQKMTDDTRTVVWDAAFTPFGEDDSIIGAETNNWRFPGQYADVESGLSYNWHRTYDPAIGRYLQSDPIGLAGGLNTYAYVGGNPVTYVDPWGLIDIFIGGAGDATSKVVANYASRHNKAYGNSVYFPHDADDEILALIDQLPTCEPINLVGHSWGADTAALVAARSPRRIDLLVTVDPVSSLAVGSPFGPSYDDVAQNVDDWVNVNAAPTKRDPSDDVADLGGKWGEGVKGYPDTYMEVDANHRNFDEMMKAPGPGGASPQDLLLKSGRAIP